MTKSTFLQKLTGQFNGMKPEQIADFGEFVATFSEENLSRLYTAFEEEYLLVSPPRKGHLIKIARAAGITSERSSTPRAEYESICYLCAANGNHYRFPVESHCCPNCGNTYWPWSGVGRAGVQVSAERALGILAAYPKGPHPTLSNTPEAKAFRNAQRLHGANPMNDQTSNRESTR